jgi:hypothetical protein
MHLPEAEGTYHAVRAPRQRARLTEGPVSHRVGCPFTRDLPSACFHSHITGEAVEAWAMEAETDAADGNRSGLGMAGGRP